MLYLTTQSIKKQFQKEKKINKKKTQGGKRYGGVGLTAVKYKKKIIKASLNDSVTEVFVEQPWLHRVCLL